jgi:hypothetical protein
LSNWVRLAALAAAATLSRWGIGSSIEERRPAAPTRPVVGVRSAPIAPTVVEVRRLPSASAAPAREDEEEEDRESLTQRLLPRNLRVPPGAVIRLGRAAPVASRRDADLPSSPPVAVEFSALGDDGFVRPPDTNGAVGPAHVVTMLNSILQIQDREGTVIQTVALPDFWGTGFENLSDPNLLYDAPAARWIAAILAGPALPTRVILAVSQTDDPRGAWSLYPIVPTANGSGFPDFPRLGLSASRIVVEVNRFTPFAFGGSEVAVFDKAALYRGEQALSTHIFSPELGRRSCPRSRRNRNGRRSTCCRITTASRRRAGSSRSMR